MRKIWIWLFIVLLIPGTLLTERPVEQEISDLEKKLGQISGKDKVDILNRLAEILFRRDPSKCIQYGKEALSLARQLNDPEGEAAAFINMGMGFSYSGRDYQKALEYYRQGLKWFEKQEDQKGIADTFIKMGIAHKNLGQYQQALAYYRKALKFYESRGDAKGIAKTFNNIGIIYDDFGMYDKALEYFLKSLKSKEASGDHQELAMSFTNIGTICWRIKDYDRALEYFKKALAIDRETGNKIHIAGSLHNIGMVYQDRGSSDLALEYYGKSLEIKEGIGVEGSIAFTLNNIGVVYYGMKKYRQALKYFSRALNISKELGNQNGMAGQLGNVGAAYLKLGQLDKALPYLEECVKIAVEINAQALLRDHYPNISSLYEARGNYKKALEYFKLFHQVDKTIFNETSSQQIARLQTQYETEKKELKINSLEREKRIQTLESRVKTIVGSVLLLALGIVSVVVYRAYKHYKTEAARKEETLRNLQRESRLKLFLAGVDKHFLFNSLDSIMGLEKIPEPMKENLKNLSELYRYILSSAEKMVIPLREELEVVHHYLEIVQKNLEGRFFFKIPEVEDELLDCEILPQTILTLVENAVKHGIYQKETGGTVFIDIYKENDSLIIKINDTGVGFKLGAVHTGFGLHSIRERLRLYYKNRAAFTIKERAEGGTQAIMEVPYVSAFVK